MGDAEKHISELARTPPQAARLDRHSPWADEPLHALDHELPLPGEGDTDGLGTMGEDRLAPARGIGLALVPGLAIWAALITLFMKLTG